MQQMTMSDAAAVAEWFHKLVQTAGVINRVELLTYVRSHVCITDDEFEGVIGLMKGSGVILDDGAVIRYRED